MSYINRRSFSFADGKSPLTDEQIRALAPSAFAAAAHDSRSSRYTYIPTSEVIAGMRDNGFQPVMAKQSRTRDAGKRDFTKHMIRFRHQGAVIGQRRVGETFLEIVLVNSHDGSSAYQVMAGVFRLVCLNGMVVTEQEGEEVRIPHKGDVVSRVIEGSYEVLENANTAIAAAEAWTGLQLSRDEQLALGEAARTLRFGDAEGNVETPIQAEQMLVARRHDDRGDDLWRTFNRVQENAIRGGLSGWGRDTNSRRGRVTSRAVTGIDQDVKLNKALWALGKKMAELKETS